MKIHRSTLSATVIIGLLTGICTGLATPSAFAAEPLSNVPYGSLKSLEQGKPSKKIAYGDDSLQFAELWLPKNGLLKNGLPKNGLPKNKQAKKPLVVFIHGGCWLNAFNIKHIYPASNALAQAGYPVWSVEYRRTGDKGGAWPGSYNDIIAAIEKAKQQFEQDIVLMGHSAGGHLAVLAAKHFAKNNDKQIKQVIGLAAISDIERYSTGTNSCQTATPSFMGGDYDKQATQYDLANPMKQGFHLNTVLIHGDQDNIVPLAQSIDTEQAVKVIKGAGHFDMIHPNSRAWQAIINTLSLL